MKIKLTPQAAADLTFQSYGPQPAIDGVWLQPLKKHAALEGWFMELFRVGSTGFPTRATETGTVPRSPAGERGQSPCSSPSPSPFSITGLPTPFDLRQISFSMATPGRVNAFHIHPKVVQDELWCVVQGTMKVWLVDLRDGSPTKENRRCVVLSGEQPVILHIPSGVAHGYKAGPAGALLVYAMNSQFNLDDPNEGRLPWDNFGPELWEEDRG
jgi:dTDP-4-dehydrorhamnose 3,5-epimerase